MSAEPISSPHLHLAPLVGELSAQLTEGLSWLKNHKPPVCFTASSLRRARSAALTVHRTVIHYRDCASFTLKEGGKGAEVGLGWRAADCRPYGCGGILAPSVRESEAQSAVVNDSPVDCQSRRPGSPQRAGCEADWGSEVLMIGQPLSQLR